jgi:RNA polymerase sigma-70 factor (ECF subfamily)
MTWIIATGSSRYRSGVLIDGNITVQTRGDTQRWVFRSWLVRILLNEAVSILRQRKNRLQKFSKSCASTEVGEIIERLPSPGPDPEQALVNKQSAFALAKKMSDLGAPQRSVLLLCGVEGYTTEEVSVMLNVTPTAVRTRLFRARKKIAAALRPSGFADRVT